MTSTPAQTDPTPTPHAPAAQSTQSAQSAHSGQSTQPAQSAQSARPAHIQVLGTGGTISCTHDDNGDLVPTLSCADILEQVDPASLPQGFTAIPHDVMSIDSSSITLPQIDELVAHIAGFCSPAPAGIVVLHGTDSMEESAMAAACALQLPCPVVFTGAQRSGDDAAADGPANISRAFAAIAAGGLSAGVHIIFGGSIVPAYGAYKAHTSAETAFRNAVQESGSAPAGGTSTADSWSPLQKSQHTPRREPHASPATIAGLSVPIITTFAGDDGQLIRALRERDGARAYTGNPADGAADVGADGRIDGLVLAAMGSGNIPATVADELATWRTERPSPASGSPAPAELPVVVCSRVPTGGVSFVYGGTGGGAQLARAGLRSGGALRPSQARIALLYELANSR